MNATLKIGCLSLLLLLLPACASNHMMVAEDSAKVTRPAPDKALVVFARTTSFGGAIQSTLV